MKILGLNAYHGDSSACLLIDGQLVAAAEEERFRRVKHWAGFPSRAILYCLEEAGISLGEIDVVANNSDPRANLGRKILYTLARRPNPALLFDRVRNARRRYDVAGDFVAAFAGERFRASIHRVEHHQAHLASAFMVSVFDEAAVLSVDGFGDFSSAAWGIGRDNAIEVANRIYFPHSLGIFYQALTQYLGFPHYGDEYKVMGLAPYGEPRYLDALRRIVRLTSDGGFRLELDYFRHHREKIEYSWESGAPSVGRLYSNALCELLGPARAQGDEIDTHHRDLARSVQAMYEEAFIHLLNRLQAQTGADCLALAGGCAMNSVANGKIYARTPFKRVYVHPAAGDAGGAIGAALLAERARRPATPRFVMEHASWGPAFNDDEVAQVVDDHRADLDAHHCRVERSDDLDELCRRTARLIADGKVVGWFQGRMEWGPRALGNRSIVCDPRRADMKDILNRKIKRRESFRPFAPSILRDAVSDWFETDDDVPFMMKVFQIREHKRAQIPAVTHVDGSGRLQTVTRASNSLYYRLIEAFRDTTGVPLVLNTSFNENEPVVCQPAEALDCFLRTEMDVLVLGQTLIAR